MSEYISVEDLLEVELQNKEDFLKVKETLTRIGITSKKENKLFQSCHILHKKGKYYIVHFKELFLLDGLESNIDDNDIARRNTIAKLLQEWKLVKIVNPDIMNNNFAGINQIKIIPHSEKTKWQLCPKYHIGKK
jgi:hypothetical protein